MKMLDRYVVRNFLISAILFFVVLMSLRVVTDLFVNMDEFTKRKHGEQEKSFRAVTGEIATYYTYQSLVYFRDLGGVLIVAAAAFTLARMNHANELTAVLASGVSLHRVLMPILACAIGLNVLVIIDTELLIPPNEHRLVRSRDDVEGKETFQVATVTDCHDSVWYSSRFEPSDGRLSAPWIILRDKRLAHAGHIVGPSAYYDQGRKAWVFSPGPSPRPGEPLAHARFHRVGVKCETTTGFVPTNIGPAKICDYIQREKYPNRRINWKVVRGVNQVEVPAGKKRLTICARRLEFGTPGDYATAVLKDARFEYNLGQAQPVVCLTASSAGFEYRENKQSFGWALTDGRLSYACELDPPGLALRRSTEWLKYMSTATLNRLLRLRHACDESEARLARHTRFADFFNNIILLLVAVPFIVSRERNIKSSAGMTVLMVGVVYVFIYMTRNMEGLNPALAAWLPILVFGPVSAVMLDAVKT